MTMFGMADYLRGRPSGLDTALEWTSNLPMVPEQRGTLVPGIIPRHIAGEHPRPALAWPGLLHDPYMGLNRLLQAGADERSGLPTDDRQNARDSFDAAGLAATGGLVAPKPADALGIFGGRLAKTADHAALARAEDMWARGVPREDVWRDTGWFKGVDGKPRFEIDDSQFGATLRTKPGGYIDEVSSRLGMGGIYKHDALLDAYPDLASTRVQTMRKGDGASFSIGGKDFDFGSNRYVDHGDNVIKYGSTAYNPDWLGKTIGDENAFVGHNFGGSSFKSDGLHELQHAAQKEEGFFQGNGSGREAARGNYDGYARSAEEVEARAVQARMDLTPEQRAVRPPWLDYDVPEAQQIVRFGSGGPQMSVELPKPSAALGSAGGRFGRLPDGISGQRVYSSLDEFGPIEYRAITPDGDVVGTASVRNSASNRPQVSWVDVGEKYRRQGIASGLHSYIEDDLGKSLAPDKMLSEPSYKMWLKHSPDDVSGFSIDTGASAPGNKWFSRSYSNPTESASVPLATQVTNGDDNSMASILRRYGYNALMGTP